MKRNPKPFSVEIKKSRVHGQRTHLPSRRLFQTEQVEATSAFRKEDPQALPDQAAPRRILPSLVETRWSSSEPVEPVRHKRSAGSKAKQEQMELELNAISSEDVTDESAETAMASATVAQADIASIEESAESVYEAQPQEVESRKAKSAKPRNKAFQSVELTTTPELVWSSAQAQAQVAEPPRPSPMSSLRKAGHHRLSKRQAAVVQLPRHERWKRRLHPASW
jgi:hypothetical protein